MARVPQRGHKARSGKGGEAIGKRPAGSTVEMIRLTFVSMLASFAALPCSAQSAKPASPPNLQGVYQAIPANATLPGGLKNQGSPAAISLLPEAAKQAKTF